MLEVRPYTVLAPGYDAVMEHVDYKGWAKYIRSLFELHGGMPSDILELGCGTGAFTVEFSSLYNGSYLATDGSHEMLDVACTKENQGGGELVFGHILFEDLPIQNQFDAVLLLYDGLNYLTDLDSVRTFIASIPALLAPGGLFVFDQATRANSSNNQPYFEDSGSCDAFSYVRRNSYDPELYLHETIFELDTGEEKYLERHVQRAYQLSEIRDILDASGLIVEAAYADFSFMLADDSAERIHWVVRNTQSA